MNNTVTLTPDVLLVEPTGLDKLWSFTRQLTIPLALVRGATFDPDVTAEPRGLRHPGLAVPGKWAGTFTEDGDTSFWNVSARRSGPAAPSWSSSTRRSTSACTSPSVTLAARSTPSMPA